MSCQDEIEKLATLSKLCFNLTKNWLISEWSTVSYHIITLKNVIKLALWLMGLICLVWTQENTPILHYMSKNQVCTFHNNLIPGNSMKVLLVSVDIIILEAENLVQRLRKLQSIYQTPYKILPYFPTWVHDQIYGGLSILLKSYWLNRGISLAHVWEGIQNWWSGLLSTAWSHQLIAGSYSLYRLITPQCLEPYAAGCELTCTLLVFGTNYL